MSGASSEGMTTRIKDPRGPYRFVTKVEPESHCTLVTFDCGHVGEFNQVFTYRVGEQHRCFKCRKADDNLAED